MNEQKMFDFVNRIADNDKVAPFQNGFVVLTNAEMVKFAELIIRECAGLDFKSTGQVTTDGDIVISDFILEHFGVKE